MATFERLEWWMILMAIGLAGIVIFPLGEALGWWDALGEWGFWFSIFLTLATGLVAASRFQVLELRAASEQTRRSLGRVETGIGRVEAGIGRVEAGIGRVEANTAMLPSALPEIIGLLRDIREELRRPRPGPAD